MYDFMKATKPDALGSLLIEYVEGLKKEIEELKTKTNERSNAPTQTD